MLPEKQRKLYNKVVGESVGCCACCSQKRKCILQAIRSLSYKLNIELPQHVDEAVFDECRCDCSDPNEECRGCKEEVDAILDKRIETSLRLSDALQIVRTSTAEGLSKEDIIGILGYMYPDYNWEQFVRNH